MDNDEAEKRLVAIGKQLEKNLDDWEAWAAKGEILCSLGMHDIAIRCFDRSLGLNPNNMLTWTSKGVALSKMGRHKEADASFARARELGYPDSSRSNSER